MFKYITKLLGITISISSIILFVFFAKSINKIDAFDIFFISMCILSFVGGVVIFFIHKIFDLDYISSRSDEYILDVDIDEDLLNTYLEMCTIHQQHAPKLRTGQLLDNYRIWLHKDKKVDMFYLSDKLLVEYFKEYIDTIRYVG